MKKFESLGKSLSKNEQKKVMGGLEDPGGDDDGGCGTACNGSCSGTGVCSGSTGKCSNASGHCRCYVIC